TTNKLQLPATDRVRTPSDVLRSSSSGATPPDATLKVYNAQNILLGQFPAAIKFDTDLPPGADVTGILSGYVPDQIGIARIDIERGGKILAQVNAPASVPAVGMPTATLTPSAPQATAATPSKPESGT